VAIGGLFNKAKRLHACKGPSRHAAAFKTFTCQDRGYHQQKEKEKTVGRLPYLHLIPNIATSHRAILIYLNYAI
jgi:hypothetical protein